MTTITISSDARIIIEPTNTAPSTGSPPRIGAPWPGEGGIYAGVARGRDGVADYHLIVYELEVKDLTWDAAMHWASEAASDNHQDFSLPTRAEQALLYANVKELFAEAWYWSGEQYAGAAQYAWYQTFSYGSQSYDPKYYQRRARAVRRVPL